MNSKDSSLIPRSTGWLRILQLGLAMSGAGWGISFCFTFSSWTTGSAILAQMGAGQLDYDPMLNYWLKMASAAFGCIGIASGLACIWPVAFEKLVYLLGPFHAFLGVVLAISAFSNELRNDQHPTFIADITFCFTTALLISLPLLVAKFRGDSEKAEDLGNC
ncbi:MAG: hypothetical protein AAF585_07015 [Verrucomicrobiota bacterium]